MSGRGQRPTSGSPAGGTSETSDRNACAARASQARPSRGTTREELAGASVNLIGCPAWPPSSTSCSASSRPPSTATTPALGASLKCSRRWWPRPRGRSFSSVRTCTSGSPTCKSSPDDADLKWPEPPACADPPGSASQRLPARRALIHALELRARAALDSPAALTASVSVLAVEGLLVLLRGTPLRMRRIAARDLRGRRSVRRLDVGVPLRGSDRPYGPVPGGR
jgi:hypothetical protein